jgi:hypothetical protein
MNNQTNQRTFCPWVTPKVFADFADPRPEVKSFFDHYADWITAYLSPRITAERFTRKRKEERDSIWSTP